jgi:hypothetical protein
MLVATAAEVRTAPVPLGGDVLAAGHPVLRDALERIARGSASWRRAIDALAGTGRQAIVVTPGEVAMRDVRSGEPRVFDPAGLAEVAPIVGRDGSVASVLVVVNVAALQEIHDRRGSLPGEFMAGVDAVLAHEVYGHAVPYLEAGHVSGRCPDPVAGQAATEACAIQRENAIRAELKLGRRTDSSLLSLNLSRWLSWR